MTCQLFLLAASLAVAGTLSFSFQQSDKLPKGDSDLCKSYEECISPLTDSERREPLCLSVKRRDMGCENSIRTSCGDEGDRLALTYMTWVDNVEYSCQPEVKAELHRQYECMAPNLNEIHSAQSECWNRTCPECEAQDESCESVYMSRGCLTWGINKHCPGAEEFHYDLYSHYYTRMARHLNCTWP